MTLEFPCRELLDVMHLFPIIEKSSCHEILQALIHRWSLHQASSIKHQSLSLINVVSVRDVVLPEPKCKNSMKRLLEAVPNCWQLGKIMMLPRPHPVPRFAIFIRALMLHGDQDTCMGVVVFLDTLPRTSLRKTDGALSRTLNRRVTSNRVRWIEPGVAQQGALLLIHDARLGHLRLAVAGSRRVTDGTSNLNVP